MFSLRSGISASCLEICTCRRSTIYSLLLVIGLYCKQLLSGTQTGGYTEQMEERKCFLLWEENDGINNEGQVLYVYCCYCSVLFFLIGTTICCIFKCYCFLLLSLFLRSLHCVTTQVFVSKSIKFIQNMLRYIYLQMGWFKNILEVATKN